MDASLPPALERAQLTTTRSAQRQGDLTPEPSPRRTGWAPAARVPAARARSSRTSARSSLTSAFERAQPTTTRSAQRQGDLTPVPQPRRTGSAPAARSSARSASLGTGNADSARATAWRVTRYGFVAGLAFGCVGSAGWYVIPMVFSSDAGVQHQAHPLWPWLVGMMPVGGVLFALDGVLIGAGDNCFLRTVTVVSALAGYIPLAICALIFRWASAACGPAWRPSSSYDSPAWPGVREAAHGSVVKERQVADPSVRAARERRYPAVRCLVQTSAAVGRPSSGRARLERRGSGRPRRGRGSR